MTDSAEDAMVAVWNAMRPAVERLAQVVAGLRSPIAPVLEYLDAHPELLEATWEGDEDAPCRCWCAKAHPKAWAVCSGSSAPGTEMTLWSPLVGDLSFPVCRACLVAAKAEVEPAQASAEG